MSGGVHSNPRVNPTDSVVTGEVIADQGAPNTLANGWPVKVTDGTDVLGTAAHPLRIDPTGTTAQPVSFPPPGGATALQPNWYIPRTAHLASAALPAGGAFTTQTAQTLPAGTKKVSFWITYTRGAAGGYPQFELLWSNGTEEIRHVLGNQSSLVTTQPNGQFNTLQSQFIGPQPQSGSALVFGYTFDGSDVPAGSTTVRLVAAELGVTATPGTCAITLTAEG